MTEPLTHARRGRPRGLPQWVMALVALAALVSLLSEYGFRLDARSSHWIAGADYVLAALFGLDLGLILARSPGRLEALKTRWHEFALLGLFGAGLFSLATLGSDEILSGVLSFTHLRSVAKLWLASVQFFLVLNVALRAARAQEKYISSKIPSEYLLVSSFATLIVCGTFLLWLPGARAPDAAPLSLLDAFFTATSASCVTGLAVRDTGADFSLFGQLVILLLFQVGGFGIITFVAFGSVLATKSFSVPQTVALRDLTHSPTLSDARRFIGHVILWMLLIESVGALLLYASFPTAGATTLERMFWAVFHSVSAFCNAGFSLQGDSFVGLQSAWGVNFVLMGLIVLGGLGMPVTRELLAHRLTRAPFFRRFEFFRRLHVGQVHRRLSLQTRISLWMTGALLGLGLVGFWLLESGGLLAGMEPGQSALVSAFQSVTTRTAGFNSVPLGGLSDACLVLMVSLMAIGAGPVSTGGGIKTVTFAVLLITLRAMVKGRPSVEIGGRSLPRVLIRGALSVFVLYVLAATTILFVLSLSDPQIMLRDRLFESISALSTVGLSTGVTRDFGDTGRLVLCLAMFVGRVGPLALVLSVFRSRRASDDYRYPTEKLVVG